jgi:DNA-binding NarL/FixJ family response regulator
VATSLNISIVIIESSAIVRERIVEMLARVPNAAIVAEANTGMRGLDACLVNRPDAVVLSLELSDMNGIDLLLHIRQTRPDSRIIVLTDYPFKEVRQCCLESGADFCFDKAAEFECAIGVCEELARRRANPASSDLFLHGGDET